MNVKPGTGGTPEQQATAEPLTPERRRDLIQRYQAEALKCANPLQANLGIIGADLLVHLGHYQQLIEKDATHLDLEPGHFFDHADRYLKVARQVDRFVHLQRKAEKEAP